MASTTSPTARLCHWVCSTHYGNLPAEVRQETVTLLYDQMGCMLASATLPSCQPVVALVRRLGPPGACSIVGHPVRTCSGEVLRQELRYPLMTAAELQQKFRDLVGLRLESPRAADLERQLQAIESVEHVAPLIREQRAGRPRQPETAAGLQGYLHPAGHREARHGLPTPPGPTLTARAHGVCGPTIAPTTGCAMRGDLPPSQRRAAQPGPGRRSTQVIGGARSQHDDSHPSSTAVRLVYSHRWGWGARRDPPGGTPPPPLTICARSCRRPSGWASRPC